MVDGGCASMYFFLKGSDLIFPLSELLLFFVFAEECGIGYFFGVLLVYGVIVPILCVSFLHVKLFFDCNGLKVGVVFDEIVPEEFFFIRRLLDFPESNIRRGDNLIVHSLKCVADALVSLDIFGLSGLELINLFLKVDYEVIHT